MSMRPIDVPLMSNRAVEVSRDAMRMSKTHELFQSQLTERAKNQEQENMNKVQGTEKSEQNIVDADGGGNNGGAYSDGKRDQHEPEVVLRQLEIEGQMAGYNTSTFDIKA